MKYLVFFEKNDSARWLGHLDLMRAFERALRRSGLPLAYTEGFNPHPRFAIASALGLGVTAGSEPATVELAGDTAAEEVVNRLNDMLPPGLRVRGAEAIPDAGARDLLNSFRWALLEATCDIRAGFRREQVDSAIQGLLASEELVVERERKGKMRRMDARPFIRELSATYVSNECVILAMTLAVSQGGSVRADEVVGLLAQRIPGLAVRRVHRVRLER